MNRRQFFGGLALASVAGKVLPSAAVARDEQRHFLRAIPLGDERILSHEGSHVISWMRVLDDFMVTRNELRGVVEFSEPVTVEQFRKEFIAPAGPRTRRRQKYKLFAHVNAIEYEIIDEATE